MLNRAIVALSCALLFCISMAAAADELIFVHGVVAVDKRPYLKQGNLFPWETQAARRSHSGLQEITISNSCGFAKYSYLGTALRNLDLHSGAAKATKTIDVVVRLGEWCAIAPFAFDTLTLLRVRNFRGAYYLLSATPIYSSADNRLYVAEIDFIEANDWLSFKKQIPPENAQCYDRADVPVSVRASNFWLQDRDQQTCIAYGVFLDDIVAINHPSNR